MLIKNFQQQHATVNILPQFWWYETSYLSFYLKRTTFPAHEFKGNQFLTYSPVWHKQKYCSNQMKVPEANWTQLDIICLSENE